MSRGLGARLHVGRMGSAPLEVWFLLIALVWGVLQVFLIPPFQVPDEGDHFFRAWSVSSGQLFPDSGARITLPGQLERAADLYLGIVNAGDGLQPLPVTLDGQPGFAGYADLLNRGGPAEDVLIPSRVANYGPIGYLPQAVGIDVGRLLGATPLADFYLARLANLLACVALIFLAIRLAPYGKAAFLLVALLPMTMFELASVSCDALTLAGALLFTAMALRATLAARLQRVHIALLVAGAAILLNIKPGYWGLILLMALIPAAAAGGRWRKWALVGTGAAASALVFALTYELTVGARTGGSGTSHSQLAYLLSDPTAILGIVGTTMKDQWLVLVLESVGILGWLTVWMLPPAYLVALLAVPAQVFRGAGQLAPARSHRVGLALTALAVFLTMAAALYAFLSPPGATMFGTQGRYFEPVLLLALLAITGLKATRTSRAAGITVALVLVLAAFNFQALVSAYGW